jgi:hypothetical protein
MLTDYSIPNQIKPNPRKATCLIDTNNKQSLRCSVVAQGLPEGRYELVLKELNSENIMIVNNELIEI